MTSPTRGAFDARFAHLFQPGRIGKLAVANRIKYAAC
jgi:hypothetical protein